MKKYSYETIISQQVKHDTTGIYWPQMWLFAEDENNIFRPVEMVGDPALTAKYKYVAVWGDGFPNTYEDCIKVVNFSFFQVGSGYSPGNIEDIYRLSTGETWLEEDGGHFVVKLTDNFNGPFEDQTKK